MKRTEPDGRFWSDGSDIHFVRETFVARWWWRFKTWFKTRLAKRRGWPMKRTLLLVMLAFSTAQAWADASLVEQGLIRQIMSEVIQGSRYDRPGASIQVGPVRASFTIRTVHLGDREALTLARTIMSDLVRQVPNLDGYEVWVMDDSTKTYGAEYKDGKIIAAVL